MEDTERPDRSILTMAIDNITECRRKISSINGMSANDVTDIETTKHTDTESVEAQCWRKRKRGFSKIANQFHDDCYLSFEESYQSINYEMFCDDPVEKPERKPSANTRRLEKSPSFANQLGQEEQENKLVQLMTYLALEHSLLFEVILMLPLVAMALYIMLIEGKSLYVAVK